MDLERPNLAPAANRRPCSPLEVLVRLVYSSYALPAVSAAVGEARRCPRMLVTDTLHLYACLGCARI